MKRILAILIAILTVAALISCGAPVKQTEGTATAGNTETAGSTDKETDAATEEGDETGDDEDDKPVIIPKATDEGIKAEEGALSFLGDGEVYFDVSVSDKIDSFKVEIDGQDAVGHAVKFKEGSEISVEATGDENVKLSVFVVFGDEEGAHFTFSRNNNVTKMDALSRKFQERTNNKRIYIAVLEKLDGWNHDLSEGLNATLEPYTELEK